MSAEPIQPHPVIVLGIPGQDLLRRVLRMRVDPTLIDQVILIHTPDWCIRLRDTGPSGTQIATTERSTSIHVLWAKDDDTAALFINDLRVAIAPGDTVNLPTNTNWLATSGMILCEIEGSHEWLPDVIGPTHGDEAFFGHNRQTTYPSPPGLAIERWKITQPLVLPETESPYAIVDLTTPLALTWSGGADLIGRGECRIIPPAIGPVTLLPDGLGYALVIRQNLLI